MVDTLLNCPFCGATPLMQEHEPHTHSGFLKEAGIPDHPGSWTIECPTDGCCGMITSTKAEAIAAWNRRTNTEQTTGEPCGNALTWTKVADRLPDSDTTVMLFDPNANEPVWPGYLDGDMWRYADGMPAQPTHWADLPEGPAV
ncbi:Lar family restriction alleviation protein [Noviherbaspirillum sp. Root189]|uniref:Lar family restriction alleviation protein n=1 Tax=Noviherbaspirillum sp. Root189 TaxID=1736487 RepID=UPI00070BD2E2|nr:Lar family restriction alleviation protein [Noviherbaspirillum sp. Root189]KRB73480.1 hypothetical protein ASE07_06405 [Noviherbaspirillum sp. Root189]